MKKSLIIFVKLVSIVSIVMIVAGIGFAQPTPEPERTQRTQWWREARFGMFIHWGLYALPAGEWKGEKDKGGYSEWLMYKHQIPVAEYEKFAEKFNPVKFNADEWVGIAKRAGMNKLWLIAKMSTKVIVLTSRLVSMLFYFDLKDND